MRYLLRMREKGEKEMREKNAASEKILMHRLFMSLLLGLSPHLFRSFFFFSLSLSLIEQIAIKIGLSFSSLPLFISREREERRESHKILMLFFSLS